MEKKPAQNLSFLSKRPVLKIPFSSMEKILEIICIACLAILLIMTFRLYGRIPETIPTHFGGDGVADGFGGKGSLIFMPLISVFIFIMLSVSQRFPHTYNYLCNITKDNAEYQYTNARKMLGLMKIEMIVAFTYIQWQTIATALGKVDGLGAWFLPVFLVVLFGSIGLGMKNMISNRS